MLEFFIEGGMPMVFLVVLGLGGLISAGRFVRSPDPRRVPTVVSLSVALGFAAVTGVVTDLHVVAHVAARDPEPAPLVLQGVSESLTPAILGGAVLCVMWMLMAAGFRRLAVRLPPG